LDIFFDANSVSKKKVRLRNKLAQDEIRIDVDGRIWFATIFLAMISNKSSRVGDFHVEGISSQSGSGKNGAKADRG
jgi:hypothetical protein